MSDASDSVVAIIDSGGANINSVLFAFERLNCQTVFTSNWDTIRSASHVVLPGVGSAAASMNRLKGLGLDQKIPTLTQPVIGICLGMQLLFESSQEFERGSDKPVPCLGIIPAQIKKLKQEPGLTIPHMGWNQNDLEARPSENVDLSHEFLANMTSGFYSYFVHSYAAPIGPWTIARCCHGQWFSSMVCHQNFLGIQFHPERSSTAGQDLLRRFVHLKSELAV